MAVIVLLVVAFAMPYLVRDRATPPKTPTWSEQHKAADRMVASMLCRPFRVQYTSSRFSHNANSFDDGFSYRRCQGF